MITLSVIISTRNRSRFLPAALTSLTNQTFPAEKIEVIVVNNGSSDNTDDVLRSFTNRIRNFHCCNASAPGLHIGRHLGMKMAKADILVYTDDDIEAFPTWLEGIASSFDNQDVTLVGGKILPKFETPPPLWIERMWRQDRQGHRIIDTLSLLDLGDDIKAINPFQIYGCNFSVRRSVLEEAQGFHPDAFPENMIRFRGDGETHISRFISDKGHLAIYHPKASVFHVIPKDRLTEAYFCKRAYLQGISDSYTQIRNASQETSSPARRLFSFLRLHRKKWRLYAGTRQRLIGENYYRGFSMHQDAVKKDRTLYEWIMRTHYLDGYLPAFPPVRPEI